MSHVFRRVEMDVKYSFSLQAISCEFVTFSLSMIISSGSLFDDSVPLFFTERICCQIVLVAYDQLLSLRNVFVWRFVSVFLLSFCNELEVSSNSSNSSNTAIAASSNSSITAIAASSNSSITVIAASSNSSITFPQFFLQN